MSPFVEIALVLIGGFLLHIDHYIGDLKTKDLWPMSAMSVPYWLTAIFWKAQDDKNKQPVR